MWEELRVESFHCQFHLLTCTQITDNWCNRFVSIRINPNHISDETTFSKDNVVKILSHDLVMLNNVLAQ